MIDLRFESEAVPADTFQVLQFDGEEEISHLFRFELRLVSRDPEIDLASVLQNHAKLAITTQDNTRYVHGMLCEFEQGGEWHSGLYEYRAVLVPRLWMMTQSTQNQIFQTQTVPAIVERELGSVAEKGRHPLVAAGLGADDYEIYNTASYAEREYVVQFKETDFNFISRLMEHEGIYYYFEHDDHREKMVITDTMATEQISAQNSAAFQANVTAARYDDSVVHKLSRIQTQIPASVLVSDHNYRAPDLPMQASGDVAQDGIGFVTEFGAHFKSPEEGVTLAEIRAEEYRCRQNIYSGESNIASFACGHLCSLDRHFRSDYNQDYLLTRVTHHGSQDIESWGKVGSTSYHNEFSCIPATLTYRPQRLTPKPKLYGIMNGTIDSEQDLGGRADLDEQGRYKVKMPFDISGAGEGMGSRRIRMAQPYGGGGAGMSFPLVKGTEVIWTCIDGDIDRPIITGAVPNPLNPSVTTTENANSNVIKTTSGITMGFDDGSGGAGQAATGTDSSLAPQQQNQSIHTKLQPSQDGEHQIIGSPGLTASSQLPDYSVRASIEQQQQGVGLDLYSREAYSNEHSNTNETAGGKRWHIGVPDYDDAPGTTTDGSNDSFLRLGKASGWETTIGGVFAADGWLEFTDGYRNIITNKDSVSITEGTKTEIINGGNYSLNISNGALMESDASQMWHDSFTDVGGGIYRRFTVDWTSSSHITFGDSEEIFTGAKFDGFLGLATGVTVGGTLSAEIGQFVSYKKGPDFSFGSSESNDLQENRLEVSTASHQMTAGTRVRINVSPERALSSEASNKPGALAVAGIVAVTTAAAAAVPAIFTLTGSETKDIGKAAANSAALGVGYGLATALHRSLIAKGYADVAACQKEGGEVAELDIKAIPPGVRLGMGAETGAPVPTVTGPGIDISNNEITIGFGPSSCIKITPTGVEIQSPAFDVKAIGTGIVLDSKSMFFIKSGTGGLSLSTPGNLGLKGTRVDLTGTAGSTLT